MNDRPTNVDWEELIDSLETASMHPTETAWNVFRYLQSHYKEMGSQQARTLLLSYMKLPIEKPSLIHSCMLAMAVKISGAYTDFRFPQFLKYWGYASLLREEDKLKQKGKDGKQYLSLKEKVDRQLQSYLLHHPEQPREGVDSIKPMYAAKVFETTQNGKRRYLVKLVAADGMELVTDSHLLPGKPWEMQGQLFDVAIRISKQGKARAEEAVLSNQRMEDAFSTVVGYVDGIDEGRSLYHIYDVLSRHYVAEQPRLKLRAGDFVCFCPIIPAEDKFKNAVVTRVIGHEEGLSAFGTYTATVTSVNATDGYLRYRITSPLPDTAEGVIASEGFASLSKAGSCGPHTSLPIGSTIRLLLFLKRGKDGVKRNHVAEFMVK